MRGRMSTEEFMVKCHRPAVTEFELLRAEIWKTGRRSVLAAQSRFKGKPLIFLEPPKNGLLPIDVSCFNLRSLLLLF